jgi:hypothetical protein
MIVNVTVWVPTGGGLGSVMLAFPQALVVVAVVLLGFRTFTAAFIDRQV